MILSMYYFCTIILQQLLQSDWLIIIKVEMTTCVVDLGILHGPGCFAALIIPWH